MKPLKARITRGLPVGSEVETCDNSGAKVIRIFTVVGQKTVKGRRSAAGVADLVMASVRRGKPEMRKQTVFAVRLQVPASVVTGHDPVFQTGCAAGRCAISGRIDVAHGPRGRLYRPLTNNWRKPKGRSSSDRDAPLG